MITEHQIKVAIRAAAAGKPRVELRDDGPRGAGRLVLIARGSTAEWYACWHRDGKRAMSKLGSYPLLSLADARKRFREEFAPAISGGGMPASAAARRRHRANAGTVGELFAAYVASLRAAGKRSAGNVEGILSDAAAAIGSSRPAAEIEPGDVVAHLSAIHDRGAKIQAATVRAYMSAAFTYGLKAENDYTRRDGHRIPERQARRWSFPSPAASLPPGHRYEPQQGAACRRSASAAAGRRSRMEGTPLSKLADFINEVKKIASGAGTPAQQRQQVTVRFKELVADVRQTYEREPHREEHVRFVLGDVRDALLTEMNARQPNRVHALLDVVSDLLRQQMAELKSVLEIYEHAVQRVAPVRQVADEILAMARAAGHDVTETTDPNGMPRVKFRDGHAIYFDGRTWQQQLPE